MKSANPNLNFDGNTEEAFSHYRSIFGGEFTAVMRFREFREWAEQLPETDFEKIAHIELPLGENCILMATDTLESMGQEIRKGNNFSIMLDPETAEEADRLIAALSSGGSVEMPLQKTEWAERFGACTDRFGVQWMVNYGGSAARRE